MSTQADTSLTKGSASKSKRSFISRLPSFRKKKSTPPPPLQESELDMHLKSAKEDLHGGVRLRPPSQVKHRKEDEVKRRSKTSSIVASYEKRLSDLKDEENQTNGKKSKGKSATPGNCGNGKTSSRFGFGFTWQKVTSIENGTVNGKSDFGRGKSTGDELNANIKCGSTASVVRGHGLELNLPPGSPPESTTSVRTPESDRSSVSSSSSAKLYGQPMPYRSVFSDEPRGIKRQASSSQSEGWNSSSISMSRSTSPLHDSNNTCVHHTNADNQLQLNSTFTKDDNAGNLSPDVINRTFPIEESPTCIVNRTFKLEPAEDGGISSEKSRPTVEEDLPKAVPELAQRESPISCGAVEPCSSTASGHDSHDVSSSGLSEARLQSLDEVMPPEQDASRPSASPALDIPIEINSSVYSRIKSSRPGGYLSPRHRHHSGTMGGMQSTGDAFSTPVRPLDLALQHRKPHISAIKHCSESLDSCELDSICSEDLMCDSRYLDDDMFYTKDESSCLLSRSLSAEETAALYRTQHVCPTTGRARAVSVDQAQLQAATGSLEKRVGVTRGLSPSPLAIPSGRRGGRSFPAHPVPDELCQSPVEELQSLIYSSSYRKAERNKNGNANSSRVRSQSGGKAHPLRPPRWPSLPPDEDGAVLVDATVYRHMIQDMTSVKTMLLKLKRALQTVDNASSPLEHSLGQISPCSSLPTSPCSEANPIQEVIIEDLKEENVVLRKEVKNLQELLADAQQKLNELHLHSQMVKPEQCHVSTQITSETHHTSETKDQSLQVNLPTSSFPSKAPSSSPTRRKCRAEVSKIKAAYEEYIRLHSLKVGEVEKVANGAPCEGSPLKVGRSPTSSPEPSSSQLMETSPPETRRRQQRSRTPPSSKSSPERVQAGKIPKTRIPSSPTKDSMAVNSHVAGKSPSCNRESQKVMGGQASPGIQASPRNTGPSPGATTKKAGGPKKQTSRSKLVQPASYKSKLSGSQDSLISDGSQQDDGSQPAEDRRGSHLKRQLSQPQQSRSTATAQKIQSGNRQGLSELQHKGMQEINSSSDGIPKPKEIRMMPSRQQAAKLCGLPPRGPIAQQTQRDNNQPQGDERENSGVPPKIPSLLPMLKAAATTTKQEPTAIRRGAPSRQPALIDANSNPVAMQNGVSMRPSGLQQAAVIRRAAELSPPDARPKAGPIPTSQFTRQKQSPPGLARSCPSRSPERESSGEEQATPPASPKTKAQQQQQQRGSRIGLPQGRGTSKLPRGGSGIPTRRTNYT